MFQESFKKIFFLLLMFCQCSLGYSAFDFADIKKGLVRIDVDRTYPLRADSDFGSYSGTGFVVDKERRFIITNKHVVDVDAQNIKLRLSNGNVSTAKIIYIDPLLDISIIQADASANFDGIKSLHISKQKPSLEKVYLVGDDEGEGFSSIEGSIIDNHETATDNNGWLLKSKIRSEGGSSGSPLVSAKGSVIGLHFAGTKSTSLAISAFHLSEILSRLVEKKTFKKNDVGIKFGLLSIGETFFKYKEFSRILRENYNMKKVRNDFKVLTVGEIAAYSSVYNNIEQGNIVLKINGKPITHIYDAFNEVYSGVRTITVLNRSGASTYDVTTFDYKEIPKKHFLFSGAVFRDISTEDRYLYNMANNYHGVMCVFSSSNSPFNPVAKKNESGGAAFTIVKVDGKSIDKLDDFVKYVSALKDNSLIEVTFADHLNGAEKDTKDVKINSNYFGKLLLPMLASWASE